LLKITRSGVAKDSIFELSIESSIGCIIECGFIEEMRHVYTLKLGMAIFAIEYAVYILVVIAGAVTAKENM
jgi:hypothetical protein